MKKLTVLAFHSDREQVTNLLMELGVVHLEMNPSVSTPDLATIRQKKSRLEEALHFIDLNAEEPANDILNFDHENVLGRLSHVRQELDKIHQERISLERDLELLRPWGTFNPDHLDTLKARNICFSYFKAKKKKFRSYDFGSLVFQEIHQPVASDETYFVVISQDQPVELPFERLQLPLRNLEAIEKAKTALDQREQELIKEIRSWAAYRTGIKNLLVHEENILSFHLGNESYKKHAGGEIMSITGWLPTEKEQPVVRRLREKKMVFYMVDPAKDDHVPILLKNRSYPRLFEPITRIFQLPGYYELDLTPFVAVFFPIFFAYCLGDAGYGLVLSGAAFIGWFTFLKGQRNIALLGIILGGLTALMGIIKSGSVFGQPTLSSEGHPLLSYLSRFVLIPDDQTFFFNAFTVSLLIGVIQIVTGVIISISNNLRYHSVRSAISQVGKLMIIISAIGVFLTEMQEVAELQSFTAYFKVFLTLGIVLVLLFHNMNQPLLTRITSGFLPLFFIFTGILGDVLSYVRLFALGVASSVLGLVVNQIGMQIMNGSWWSIALGILFLVFGHGLNLALAALGAFVHPLRLTFVEFYNNAQFEGGGIEYRPFKRLNIHENGN